MGLGLKRMVEEAGCTDIRLEVCTDTSAAKGVEEEVEVLAEKQSPTCCMVGRCCHRLSV